MNYLVTALALRGFDYRETDQIVRVFSRQMGKITLIACGVKKPKSSLRGLVQPFCFSEMYIRPSGEMFFLTQGRLLEFFPQTRSELKKALEALYIMELLDKALGERDVNEEVFALTLQTLRFMESHKGSPLILRFFELKLLEYLGYKPVLNRCSRCSKADNLVYFNPGAGGVLCSSCGETNSGRRVMAPTVAALGGMQRGQLGMVARMVLSDPVQEEMERVLEGFLEYYLESKNQVKTVIKELKGYI